MKEELHECWKAMTEQNFVSRLRIFFDMYIPATLNLFCLYINHDIHMIQFDLLILLRCDKNGDGKLTEDEVKRENKLSKFKAHAVTYAALVMKELDPDNLGYIEIAQLETLVRGLVNSQGSERTLRRSHGLGKSMTTRLYRHRTNRPVRKTADFIHENWKRKWVLSLWMMLNTALDAWKFEQYRRRSAFQVMGYCVCIAKAAAETLKLNMALILITVRRNMLTRLRLTALNSIFPFDDNINFHKIIASAIAIGTVVHTLAHVTCDFPRIITCPKSKFMTSMGLNFNYKQPTYPSLRASAPGVTGTLMILIMTFSFTLATHSFRRSVVKLPSPLHHLAGFNAFWYAHQLLALTWMYLTIPVLFYACEGLIRKLHEKSYCVAIIKAAIYPGNVLSIHVKKPPGFKCKSGMYLFIKYPDVTPFEWHPFSITSTADGYLSVHIRS
ncbi:putative respiratory burst oxidase homolog protein H [Musa acuminata AAA Group]|uniref:putative respiratory burst oxidase homolog protein H n=1 Tax=Musa acuminata AAA Group TaxID=214697 RepID=UPI0031D80977